MSIVAKFRNNNDNNSDYYYCVWYYDELDKRLQNTSDCGNSIVMFVKSFKIPVKSVELKRFNDTKGFKFMWDRVTM